jgi:transposase
VNRSSKKASHASTETGNGVSRTSTARRHFSREHKEEILALVRRRRAEGATWAQIGRELEIRPTLLHQWAQDLGSGPLRRGESAPTGLGTAGLRETLEDEVRRLRRENEVLRKEREFAKKAAAFFAKESL